jgi:hypothetical protein
MDRREFGKAVGIGVLAGGLGITTMGLSCNTVLTDIEDYVPIGLNAFNQILTAIDPPLAQSLAPIIADVKSAFADLAADVQSYQNAPAADKATWKLKITEALNIVISNLQQFWNDAHIPNAGLAATIENVLQVILSTLAAFLPMVGGVLATPNLKQPRRTVKIVPRSKAQLSPKQVKADINAAFAKGGLPNKVY